MSGESREPLGKETARAGAELAKFGSRLLDSVDKFGEFAAGVAGRAPHDFVGLLIGDWLAHTRIRRWAKLQAETKRILEERGVKEPYEEISPSIAVPLIEAAVDESREELAELWAKLLAAAFDPKRKGLVRLDLIDTMKQLEPLDAAVIQTVFDAQGAGWALNVRDQFAQRFGVSIDEIEVSFQKLVSLGCFFPVDLATTKNGQLLNSPRLAPRGRLLIQAVH